VTYELPQLEEILKETYGVIVYQEQVMQIASALAGFSLGEADLLRRAMGKKKESVMEAQRKKFLDGAHQRGIDTAPAKHIFDLIKRFAGYGFNKSHSTAYALLAYQTAYLKTHYPVQFMAALLTNEMSNTDKIVQYLNETREMGIEVLPPDINQSGLHFVGSGERKIRFGLGAVKNVGEGAIQRILQERRENGPFTGFYQFCESIDPRLVNKKVLESLIKAGAMDGFGGKRKSLFESIDKAIERAHKAQRDRLSGQKGLFSDALGASMQEPEEEIVDRGEWPDRERWTYERETLGFYLTGHPLQKFEAELKCFSRFSTRDITEQQGGREVAVGGIVGSLKKTQTRQGESMAVFQLEDMEGSVDVLLWPSVYERFKSQLESEFPILVRGRADVDARGEIKILCSEILDMSSIWKEGVRKARIRIQVPTLQQESLDRFGSLLRRYPGKCSLEFELVEEKAYTLHLIPADKVLVNPVPAFVQEVEGLFGRKSCILEIQNLA
jgi:DNA polymerase-3 subunit alpha